jgi:hypothetical protein
MHFIRSVAIAATLLTLPSVVFFASASTPAATSAIAAKVGEIKGLIADDTKKMPHLVKFLEDPKHWTGFLDSLHTTDKAGTSKLVEEVAKVLKPATGGKIAYKSGKSVVALDTAIRDLEAFTFDPAVDTDVNAFKPDKFVEQIATTLNAYKTAIATDADVNFDPHPAIDDLAKPLADCFSKLDDTKFTGDKLELLKKLKMAVDNKDYEDSNLIWYILGGVLLLAIVAGIVIYVVLQRRNK